MEYILIKKDKTKKIKNKDENIIVIPLSPIQLIKKSFEEVEIKKTSGKKGDIARSDWKGTFYKDTIKAQFSIKEYSKQRIIYLSIHINNDVKIDILESIDSSIHKNMSDDYIIITSYDSISEIYCNKIYSKLNRFERKLRELLFKMYTFHYGINYYEQNFNSELKEKVKTDKTIYSESKKIEKIKQALYELTYNDIIDLLFTPKWLEDDEENKLNLIEKLNNNENLPQQELIEKIESFKPKSDWERLFVPYIGQISNFQDTINELRELRNRVAHCKFFRKKHYEKCLEILDTLDTEINKALKEIMKIDFQKLNAEYLSNKFQKMFEAFNKELKEFGKNISEMISDSTNQIISIAQSAISNGIKESLNRLKSPLLIYNKKIAIKRVKYLKSKKYIKKKD